MKFYMPVRVFDEKECVSGHAKDISALGKRALIVTGRSSSKINGSLGDVTDALDKTGVEYVIFSDVEENPSTSTVLSAGKKFAGDNIDFVIGVGGGSAMDAAKAIALVISHPEADLDYLYDASKDPSALPVVCVPTTCGTGSEVTGVSVLTRHDKNTKISMVHRVYPALALIDGKYLSCAPSSLIANSSVDALAHLYESSLSAKADDYVRMIASEGLRIWASTKDVLTGKRLPKEADQTLLMRSSTLAGMSIALGGTSLPHALSYTLTYDLGIPHGKAVGYFLAGFIEAAPEDKRRKLLELSGFCDTDDLRSFIEKALGDIKVDDAELDKAFAAVKANPSKMNSASFAVDENVLRRVTFS